MNKIKDSSCVPVNKTFYLHASMNWDFNIKDWMVNISQHYNAVAKWAMIGHFRGADISRKQETTKKNNWVGNL